MSGHPRPSPRRAPRPLRPAPPARPESLEGFFAWEAGQDARFEYRRGQIRMMTGGPLRNTWIAQSVAAAINAKLPPGGPCRAYVENAQVRLAAAEAGYYPDVVVDCGTYDGDAQAAAEPVVVFEVLSATTRERDFSEKVPDYQDAQSIRQIVLVEPETPLLHVWVWDDQPPRWRQYTLDDRSATLKLPALELELSLEEIYRNA